MQGVGLVKKGNTRSTEKVRILCSVGFKQETLQMKADVTKNDVVSLKFSSVRHRRLGLSEKNGTKIKIFDLINKIDFFFRTAYFG